MWGRMCSSRRGSGSISGGGSDPERERRVRSDSARKWTNRGLSPSPSFRVRETDEYNRRHGRTPSSAAGGEIFREWSEELEETEFVPVKQEPEELGNRGVIGPEDFVVDVDAVAAAIAEWSLREEAERWCHHEELEDLVFQQAFAANLAAKEKDDEWRRNPRGAEGEVHRPWQLRRGGLSSSTASSMAASSPSLVCAHGSIRTTSSSWLSSTACSPRRRPTRSVSIARKALRLAIELSEREAVEDVAAKAKAARLVKEQAHVVRRMAGIITSSDVFDGCDDDDFVPPAVDDYTERYSRTGDRKRKDPTWNGDFLRPSLYLFTFSFLLQI
nr:uncharacterized protein LOC109749520 [Aegilops tauschii subsp. strangulata]